MTFAEDSWTWFRHPIKILHASSQLKSYFCNIVHFRSGDVRKSLIRESRVFVYLDAPRLHYCFWNLHRDIVASKFSKEDILENYIPNKENAARIFSTTLVLIPIFSEDIVVNSQKSKIFYTRHIFPWTLGTLLKFPLSNLTHYVIFYYSTVLLQRYLEKGFPKKTFFTRNVLESIFYNFSPPPHFLLKTPYKPLKNTFDIKVSFSIFT